MTVDHLLLLVPSLRGGGAERTAVNLANHWAGQAIHVTFVTFSDGSDDAYVLDPSVDRVALGLERRHRSRLAAPVTFLRRLRALRRQVRAGDPDVVLAFMLVPNLLVALLPRDPRRVTVGSERNYVPEAADNGRLALWLRARMYGRLDAMTAGTERTAAWLRGNTGSPVVTAIPNMTTQAPGVGSGGIDPGDVVQPERSLLLAVGRLHQQKGFDLLLAAFREIAADLRAWDLVILGEGVERNTLLDTVDRHGLNDRVSLPGRAPNVGDWYERADAFVLCSRYEGFPNALIEAMAAGLPVLSTDCPTGPREIVNDGDDGLLVTSGDPAALAAGLRTLLTDTVLRERLAAAAPSAVSAYTTEQVAASWEALFETLDGTGRTAATRGLVTTRARRSRRAVR